MDVERRLRTAIESFAADLDGLLRQATLEAVAEMFAGHGGARSAAAPQSPGAKRTQEELEELCEALLQAIVANPGLRIEQLADVMNVSSRSLTLPTRKLLASRRIRKKGEKRATTYFGR